MMRSIFIIYLFDVINVILFGTEGEPNFAPTPTPKKSC
jgi:hypothetical protein